MIKLISIIIYCTIPIALLSWVIYFTTKDYFTDVHVGQKWVYYYGSSDNPFKQPQTDTNTVIAVKDGYVLYRNSWQNNASSSKRYFLIGSKLITK